MKEIRSVKFENVLLCVDKGIYLREPSGTGFDSKSLADILNSLGFECNDELVDLYIAVTPRKSIVNVVDNVGEVGQVEYKEIFREEEEEING